jgi:hypothetical protein
MNRYVGAGGVRFWNTTFERATAAIMTEEAGGDPQKLLAHGNPATTQRYIGRRKFIDVVPMRKKK